MRARIIARAVRDEKFLGRFWAKVRIGPGCWNWTACGDKNGYGYIGAPRAIASGRSVLLKAHRIAWTIANGSPRPGMSVCHRCDNPKCVRIEHLFVSTHRRNMLDMKRKGRSCSGARNDPFKLSHSDIRSIRRLRAGGMVVAKIMARFDITYTTVWNICTRRRWANV